MIDWEAPIYHSFSFSIKILIYLVSKIIYLIIRRLSFKKSGFKINQINMARNSINHSIILTLP